MTIINMAAQPYTSENILLGTGCAWSLTTGLFAPSSGVCQSYADRALVSLDAQIKTGNARFKMNGSTPATSCGHFFGAGDYLVLDDPSQMKNIVFFNEGNTATVYIHVTYFGG